MLSAVWKLLCLVNGATVVQVHELHELQVLLITMNDGIDPASGKRFA